MIVMVDGEVMAVDGDCGGCWGSWWNLISAVGDDCSGRWSWGF